LCCSYAAVAAPKPVKPGSIPDDVVETKPLKPGALPAEKAAVKPTNGSKHEEFWYGLKPDGVTAFRLVSDFNLKQLAPDRNYLHQVTARVTPVHPLTDKKTDLKPLFDADIDLVRQTLKIEKKPDFAPAGRSVEYRWNVERPGKDVLYVKPRKEIFLPDRNRIFSFYVRGAGHAHQIFAVFRGPNKVQQEIFVCSLDYQGWKRFEVVIPPYLRLRNPLKYNRFELYFLGLKVQSYFRDQPGTSVFNLAEMFILADTSDKKIPGSDMPSDF
jgi:hypothetical protein